MNQLIDYFNENQIPYSDEIIRKFDAYRSGILQWNQFVNLTAIRDPQEFTVKHFIDSATCFCLPEYAQADKIVDMGTGAGFPGVPLAILSPEKEFVLEELKEGTLIEIPLNVKIPKRQAGFIYLESNTNEALKDFLESIR